MHDEYDIATRQRPASAGPFAIVGRPQRPVLSIKATPMPMEGSAAVSPRPIEHLDAAPGHRNVVITGGSSGIGRAAARLFARHGDDVVLIARGRDALENAANEIRDIGRRVMAIPLDVARADHLADAVQRIEQRMGPIDVWVNGAATMIHAPMAYLTADELRRVNDVTYLGTAFATMEALAVMRRRNAGVIVQIMPARSSSRSPEQATYRAAKQAVSELTRSLQRELKADHSNVRVVCVRLPAINTPLYDHAHVVMAEHPRPAGPVYQPIVAASAILEASTGRTRTVTVRRRSPLALLVERIRQRRVDRPAGADRTDSWASNLWTSLPGDPGAHGAFDRMASPDGRTARRPGRLRGALGIAVALVVAGALTAARFLTSL